MKYVVDTSLINKLVDGSVNLDELPQDGDLVATNVQIDEISRTKNIELRNLLLSAFDKVIEYNLPTESNESYKAIKADLDSRNGGKANNRKDALIAEVALKNGYVLLTADWDLWRVALNHNIEVWFWASQLPKSQIPPMEPMTKKQLDFVKAEIENAYLHLIGKSQIDPVVIELMKLSALAEAQRRYESKEPL
jgi:predicted nucleic acid-binding protein